MLDALARRLRVAPDENLHVALVLALTLATGAVDAVSYFSLDHVFTANMSGNMALLGIGLATHLGDVAGNIYAFAGFVMGSILVARFVRWHRGPFLRLATDALLVELGLLVMLTVIMGVVDTATNDMWRFVVCGLLAAAMGIQTGIARHMSIVDVNTTVATMTLHDLAAASRLAGGTSVRWRRRIGVVLALLVGGFIGTTLDQAVRWAGLAFTSFVIVAVIVFALTLIRREGLGEPDPAGVAAPAAATS